MNEDEARRRLFQWCVEKGVSDNDQRMLNNCFIREDYRTTKYYHHFAKFCNDELGESFNNTHFDISTHIRYYFSEFARLNDIWAGLLERCVGEYEVVRIGFYDMMEKSPNFADRYHLEISRPGDGGLFLFNYSRLARDGGKDPGGSIWEGYVLAANDYLYLIGVGLEKGGDAVLFALRRHDELGPQVLVGTQYAMMADDEEHRAALNGSRDLAVFRRIAAFRTNTKKNRAKFEAAACAWVLEEPRGLVLPVNFHPPKRQG